MFCISILLLGSFGAVASFKILAILPVSSHSHFKMNELLLVELTKMGHEVDVVSHFPREKPLPRYNDISIVGSTPSQTNCITMEIMETKNFLMDTVYLMGPLGAEQCKQIFAHEAMHKLKHSSKKYDLLIIELFTTDCMLGFAHHFNAPFITTISSVMLPWGNYRIGNYDNTAHIPNYFYSYTNKMTFFERIWNTIQVISTTLPYEAIYSKHCNEAAREFFGNDLPDLRQLASNTSLVLLNSHFSLNSVKPMMANFIEVGGIHIKNLSPLPKNIATFLEDASDDVIYFSMGSMVQTESLGREKLQALMDAFAELPCKVLFKGDAEKISQVVTIPINVRVEGWFPQLEILCYPKVSLFVTHGGLLSTQEAVHCGVPILAIPIFCDHFIIVRVLEDHEIGVLVRYQEITKENILMSVRKLLNDPKYKSNVKKASKMFKDRPNKPLDTAVYWVEYVARHRGAPHLRSSGANFAWHQHFLVDVICTLLAVFLLSLALVFFVIRPLLSASIRMRKQKAKVKKS